MSLVDWLDHVLSSAGSCHMLNTGQMSLTPVKSWGTVVVEETVAKKQQWSGAAETSSATAASLYGSNATTDEEGLWLRFFAPLNEVD